MTLGSPDRGSLGSPTRLAAPSVFAWRTFEDVLSPGVLYTVPQSTVYADLIVALQYRGDTAATSIGLVIEINGMTTTGSYHSQELGASNGADSVPESTTKVFGAIAAGSSVADYFSTVFLFFPAYCNARQKVCIISGSVELAALNQRIYLGSLKRHVPDSSPLVTPIQTLKVYAATGNVTGTRRYKIANAA